MKKLQHIMILGVILAFCAEQALAGEIRVAVASNFTDAIKDIARSFEKKTGHQVTLAFGSTGNHYAQIKNSAPFEAFFSADIKRPRLL
jgi:molybdate transport system substrate-binding protein